MCENAEQVFVGYLLTDVNRTCHEVRILHRAVWVRVVLCYEGSNLLGLVAVSTVLESLNEVFHVDLARVACVQCAERLLD